MRFAVFFFAPLVACDRWALLREGAEAWNAMQFDEQFSVNVGDETGTLFKWESPGFSSVSTRMAGASLSKWPAAVMIAGLVHDGTLAFDDLASKHLRWWPTDKKDPRSRVRLHHLLSFTSGYSADSSASPRCSFMVAPKDQYMKCAESLFNLSTSYGHEPGTHWAYLTTHLQFAGAMAVAASGMEIDHLFQRYLYTPFNMTSTTWSPRKNPQLAVGITTTANDFEQLLHRLLTYAVLPKAVLDVMETDTSQPPCSPSGDGWFGHYGMGHWWECIGYGTPRKFERQPLPKVCTDAAIQAGPGMYGYYPLIDRSGGGGQSGPRRPKYYFQIALQENEELSGIPEYLRILMKPVVDVILAGGDPWDAVASPRHQLLEQGAGLLQRDLDDIKSALQTCQCLQQPTSNGQPYAALGAGLKADEPSLTRRELTATRGEGLLLRDLVTVQKTLGACLCEGRGQLPSPSPEAMVEDRIAEDVLAAATWSSERAALRESIAMMENY